MLYTYTLQGETPSKKNSVKFNSKYRTTFKTKRFTDWHKMAVEYINLFCQKPVNPIDFPVLIEMEFIHGDRRRRDCDNGCSSILDLLQDVGVLADDNFKIVNKLVITNSYEEKNPHCKITISKI